MRRVSGVLRRSKSGSSTNLVKTAQKSANTNTRRCAGKPASCIFNRISASLSRFLRKR